MTNNQLSINVVYLRMKSRSVVCKKFKHSFFISSSSFCLRPLLPPVVRSLTLSSGLVVHTYSTQGVALSYCRQAVGLLQPETRNSKRHFFFSNFYFLISIFFSYFCIRYLSQILNKKMSVFSHILSSGSPDIKALARILQRERERESSHRQYHR